MPVFLGKMPQCLDSWFSLLPLSQTDPLWLGLCGSYCRVQNLRLSMANLEVANHSLLLICVHPSAVESTGEAARLSGDQWFTSALKAQVDLRLAFGRTHAATGRRFTNCLAL